MTADIRGPGGRVASEHATTGASEHALPPFPFIVARGRSGTTLLRAMFDEHHAMCDPG